LDYAFVDGARNMHVILAVIFITLKRIDTFWFLLTKPTFLTFELL
jgi:hypothetical protein